MMRIAARSIPSAGHSTPVRLVAVVMAMAMVVAAAAFAAVPADEALDARLRALESELRCLVCQNQTLAESNAPLAEDLRKEVRELAVSGKSDGDIRAYLVARYGDFVLYKPPVEPVTYLLWFGPFALLGIGVVVWMLLLRRRSAMSASEPASSTDDDVLRARELLDQ
jgi:cytochrome c-type biogenesis protein CcmH